MISFETIIYPICLLFVICYPIPWLMHLCAIANAATKRDTRIKFTKANLNSSQDVRRVVTTSRVVVDKRSDLMVADERNNSINNNTARTQTPPTTLELIIPATTTTTNDNTCTYLSASCVEHNQINSNNNLIDNAGDAITMNNNHSTIANIANLDNINNRHHHQQYLAYNFDRFSTGQQHKFRLPGVSIIKPLVGVDKNLEENLETFFQLCYPTYELLFCVQDLEDEAVNLVQKLLTKYPRVDSKLFMGGQIVGVNPKINNMQPAYEAAKHELVLISDSGISMKSDTLSDMVLDMTDNVALVHQMPFVRENRKGFVALVEKVYFGTAHARAYLTADLINVNCPTGMSALMRKHLLDEVGGIKAFGKYLAEDFFFAKSFTDRGWEICICRQPAWQNSSSGDTIWNLYGRIERWIKLRFAMVPHWTLLEPFSECLLLGVIESSIHAYLWAFNPFIFFAIHCLVWLLFDFKLLCTIQGGQLGMKVYEFLLAWLLRESTALFIFMKALLNPKVTWRDRKFKLKWGGLAEEVPFHANAIASSSSNNNNNNRISNPMSGSCWKRPNGCFSASSSQNSIQVDCILR